MRAPGIEPESRPWQGRVLPLNHARNFKTLYIKNHFTQNPQFPSAPGGIRTPTKTSEAFRDIHFTTGAYYLPIYQSYTGLGVFARITPFSKHLFLKYQFYCIYHNS